MALYEGLEDEFGDVVGKARRGQELSVARVASRAGLGERDVERVEAYDLVPDAEVVDRLAQALSLNAAKLRGSAAASFFPDEPGGRAVEGVDVRMLVLGREFRVNGYVVICRQTGRAAIVDPGFEGDRLLAVAREVGARVEQVLLTHGHGDHVGALAEVLGTTGAEAAICEADLGLTGPVASRIQRRLLPGDELMVGAQRLRVAATPGHTPGSCSLIHERVAFVGDALFAGSLGGTRRRSDYEAQRRTVAAALLSLPERSVLYPGHGPATTVAEERRHNPFFDGTRPTPAPPGRMAGD